MLRSSPLDVRLIKRYAALVECREWELTALSVHSHIPGIWTLTHNRVNLLTTPCPGSQPPLYSPELLFTETNLVHITPHERANSYQNNDGS